MATNLTTGFPIPAVATTVRARSNRRLITPEARRARQILERAIEYLCDEFVRQGLTYSSGTDQLEASRILVALNRQVYNECPEAPSFGERCRKLLHALTV
jgi:hypothetical protein